MGETLSRSEICQSPCTWFVAAWNLLPIFYGESLLLKQKQINLITFRSFLFPYWQTSQWQCVFEKSCCVPQWYTCLLSTLELISSVLRCSTFSQCSPVVLRFRQADLILSHVHYSFLQICVVCLEARSSHCRAVFPFLSFLSSSAFQSLRFVPSFSPICLSEVTFSDSGNHFPPRVICLCLRPSSEDIRSVHSLLLSSLYPPHLSFFPHPYFQTPSSPVARDLYTHEQPRSIILVLTWLLYSLSISYHKVFHFAPWF